MIGEFPGESRNQRGIRQVARRSFRERNPGVARAGNSSLEKLNYNEILIEICMTIRYVVVRSSLGSFRQGD